MNEELEQLRGENEQLRRRNEHMRQQLQQLRVTCKRCGLGYQFIFKLIDEALK